MSRLVNSRSAKIGLAPGTLVHVGSKKVEHPLIRVMDYGPDYFNERELDGAESLEPRAERSTISWINVDGLHDTALIRRFGNDFQLHDLVLEDILHTAQRPKFEDHGDYFYIVLKMLWSEPETGRIESEQVSLLLRDGIVLTFQERPGDVLDKVRSRIREGKGRARSMGADYLAYALLDAIVDQYFVVLEHIGTRLEDLEERLLESPGTDTLHALHLAKRDLIDLRKAAWPLRELVAELRRSESALIGDATRRFIHDLSDHAVQILDTVETLRDVTGGLQDIYLSNVSNRMNEVMKTLTIMATIFIPLTFIAGIYGMNFDHMPELHWAWGYFGAWGIMAAVAVAMIAFFRRRRWL